MARQLRYYVIGRRSVAGRASLGDSEEKRETEVNALSLSAALIKGLKEWPDWAQTSIGTLEVQAFVMESF